MFKLFFSKYSKIIGLVVTVLGGIGSVLAIVKYYEAKGYNRATTEIQAAANEAIAAATLKAIELHKEKVVKALEAQKIRFEAKIVQAQQERIVEIEIQEVIKYVETIKIDPVCAIVSDDIIKLLNDSTNSANRANY